MSLATLKKKTATKYNCMSVGTKTGFSLNGGHRNQGYIGQTMLSRSLPKTLAKGAVQKGHGGCCGKFIVYPPILSAVTSTEDPNVIKSSVLDTTGMIETKYHSTCCEITVKSDDNQNRNTQQDYINHIQQKTVQEYQTCVDNTKTCNPITTKTCNNIMSKRQNTLLFNFTKPQCGPTLIPQEQSSYLLQINRKPIEPYTNTLNTANHPPIGAPNVPVDYCPAPSVCHLPQRYNR